MQDAKRVLPSRVSTRRISSSVLHKITIWLKDGNPYLAGHRKSISIFRRVDFLTLKLFRMFFTMQWLTVACSKVLLWEIVRDNEFVYSWSHSRCVKQLGKQTLQGKQKNEQDTVSNKTWSLALHLSTTHLSPKAMCMAAVNTLRVPCKVHATASVDPAGMCATRSCINRDCNSGSAAARACSKPLNTSWNIPSPPTATIPTEAAIPLINWKSVINLHGMRHMSDAYRQYSAQYSAATPPLFSERGQHTLFHKQ